MAYEVATHEQTILGQYNAFCINSQWTDQCEKCKRIQAKIWRDIETTVKIRTTITLIPVIGWTDDEKKGVCRYHTELTTIFVSLKIKKNISLYQKFTVRKFEEIKSYQNRVLWECKTVYVGKVLFMISFLPRCCCNGNTMQDSWHRVVIVLVCLSVC